MILTRLPASLQKSEDSVWFRVRYGGEFQLRSVFFYKRKVFVNMTNTGFRRANGNSSVAYMAQK